MPIFFRYLFVWALVSGWAHTAAAQTDTTFWFVAPDVTLGTSSQALDRPVLLRFAALAQPSTVRVTVPANPAFQPYTVTVPANQSVAIDLTSQLSLVENQPAGVALDRGLLIRATRPVTATYEVASQCQCNDEVFVLKGRYALGREFYTPFQNLWNNAASLGATSAIDIVATEDNTRVTVMPTQPTTTGPPQVARTVVLQRGQTYSLVAAGPSAVEHLGGTHIISTRPIAVTVKDDAVAVATPTCNSADLLGDQLLPISHLGTTYVLAKGAQTEDVAIVVTTQPGTFISTNGGSSVVVLLNAGQTESFALTTPLTSINTSAPVYVLHMIQKDCELAQAVVSPVDCTGSQQVAVTRVAAADSVWLNVTVRAGGEGSFRFNGQPNVIPAAAFAPVPGLNGEWLATQVPLSLSQLPAGATALVRNTAEVFRLGVLQSRDAATGSLQYGYFTDVTGLAVDLGPDRPVCAGQRLAPLTGTGPGAAYLWSTGATDSAITVTQPGTYWVRVQRGPCTATDTVQVSLQELAVQLTPAMTLCPQGRVVLRAQAPGNVSYRWNTGANSAELSVTEAGTYSVTVTDAGGCTAQATTQVTLVAPLIFSLGPDTLLCDTEQLTLQAPELPNSSIRWSTGSQQPALAVEQPGVYWLELTRDGCSVRDSILVRHGDCQPFIPNVITPNEDHANEFFVIRGPYPYRWQLRCFDRWGRQVFESNDYRNSWNASGQANGLYYYVAENMTLGRRYKGWVEVMGK